MNKLILFLIPIAASNSFGFVRYLLVQFGFASDVDRLWRSVPFILAIILVLALARTRNIYLGWISIVVLSIGAISSIGGIWLGLQVGSNMAVGFGVLWLLGFSFGAYQLPTAYMMPRNA